VDLPLVSVIIPARNAERSLPRAVESVLQQSWAGPLEIIVAEGRSTDGTRASLSRFGDRVQVVDNPSGLTADGLNAAIAASEGEIVVRCDAHAWLPPDYIQTAVSILEETGAANVGGVQHAVGNGLWERVVAAAQSTPLGVGDARYRLGGEAGEVDTVYLGVFRRSALEAVGGFDSRFVRNQDYELNWRLRNAGEIIWFDPRLSVDYTPRSSLRSLGRQYLDYGRWKRRMLELHPGSLRLRQVAAPALVVGLLMSLAIAPLRPRLAAFVPGAYLVALLGTASVEAVRRKDPALLLLPAAIPVMHLSWGTGFLIGQRTAIR
jgi:glycosyltransferase involved in cell wall biosynthesis